MSSEFSRIERYFAPLAGVEGLGLKDDAAVLRPPPGRELVLTVDQMIEGIHFLEHDAPDFIARKLLRRNLSDLAAMGAEPLGYLLTTALPQTVSDEWLQLFARGLQEDQQEFGFKLFGGDSSSSLHAISLTATLVGHVAPGAALRRDGARAGDEIWVTGTIGDAALGLRARRGALQDVSKFLTQRSMLPTPRLGLQLANIANAAIDISDGLVQDLGHICKASGVDAVISSHLVPVSAPVAAFGDAMLEARLTEGDDYELLLAVPPEKADAFIAACGKLQVTKIGQFKKGIGEVEVQDSSGKTLQFAKPGWSHF
jgi:thiamine-monophosphate kinase